MIIAKSSDSYHLAKKIRKFRLKVKWNSYFPENPFGKCTLPPEKGFLPFAVRINVLGQPLNNGKGFSKISKPTERNEAYHLQFPVIVFG